MSLTSTWDTLPRKDDAVLIDLAVPYAASIRPREQGRFRHAVVVATIPVEVGEFTSAECPSVATVDSKDKGSTTYRSVAGNLVRPVQVPTETDDVEGWLRGAARDPRSISSPWQRPLFMQEFGRPVGSRATFPGLTTGDWIDEDDPRFEFRPPAGRYADFARRPMSARSVTLFLVDGRPWIVVPPPAIKVAKFGERVACWVTSDQFRDPMTCSAVFSLGQMEAAVRFGRVDHPEETCEDFPSVKVLEPSLLPQHDHQVAALKLAGRRLAECGEGLRGVEETVKVSRLRALSWADTPDGDALAQAVEDVTGFVTVKKVAFPAYDALCAYRICREVEAERFDDEDGDLTYLRV